MTTTRGHSKDRDLLSSSSGSQKIEIKVQAGQAPVGAPVPPASLASGWLHLSCDCGCIPPVSAPNSHDLSLYLSLYSLIHTLIMTYVVAIGATWTIQDQLLLSDPSLTHTFCCLSDIHKFWELGCGCTFWRPPISLLPGAIFGGGSCSTVGKTPWCRGSWGQGGGDSEWGTPRHSLHHLYIFRRPGARSSMKWVKEVRAVVSAQSAGQTVK